MNKTKKDTIYVRNEDYENYRDFTQKPEWGYGSNLKLFTTTVLIGKYNVGEELELSKIENNHGQKTQRNHSESDPEG